MSTTPSPDFAVLVTELLARMTYRELARRLGAPHHEAIRWWRLGRQPGYGFACAIIKLHGEVVNPISQRGLSNTGLRGLSPEDLCPVWDSSPTQSKASETS